MPAYYRACNDRFNAWFIPQIQNPMFRQLVRGGIAIALIFIAGCSKGDDAPSTLSDPCAMMNTPAYRNGRWQLVRIDSNVLRDPGLYIEFVDDSLMISHLHIRLDTSIVYFTECKYIVVSAIYMGVRDPRQFGIETDFSPKDSLFTIINRNQFGDKRYTVYKKLP